MIKNDAALTEEASVRTSTSKLPRIVPIAPENAVDSGNKSDMPY